MTAFPINELRRLAEAPKMEALGERERQFVALRLGWDQNGRSRTQQEVAAAMGLSQPSVSYLESQTKQALKRYERHAFCEAEEHEFCAYCAAPDRAPWHEET